MMEAGNGGRAIALGIGAVVLAPILLPAIGKVAKPIAKATLKNGITLYEKGKVAVAEANEVWEDILAEAKAEAMGESPQIPNSEPINKG
ncbi:DUF5132 domain-containing protein [Phormidium pseudopriestleyi FRX01]|uniref:DUF5132 domain-containing protein n=2 Tax=Phormidium TaxID=1198 RepID=A0ABS3FMR3_9CYAN|nr:DUF5132 domain-containing protein [Phormidium pseudopriestleyi FRX01]